MKFLYMHKRAHTGFNAYVAGTECENTSEALMKGTCASIFNFGRSSIFRIQVWSSFETTSFMDYVTGCRYSENPESIDGRNNRESKSAGVWRPPSPQVQCWVIAHAAKKIRTRFSPSTLPNIGLGGKGGARRPYFWILDYFSHLWTPDFSNIYSQLCSP